jgi:hypothetical protein
MSQNGSPRADGCERAQQLYGRLVLPDVVLCTISALLPYDSVAGTEANNARNIYSRGVWTRAAVRHVDEALAKAAEAGHPVISRTAARRAHSALHHALTASATDQRWPVSLHVWDPERDDPAPNPDWTPPARPAIACTRLRPELRDDPPISPDTVIGVLP